MSGEAQTEGAAAPEWNDTGWIERRAKHRSKPHE
jgi:hypothetical protein